MLKFLSVRNFKVFKQTQFSLSNLNILTGLNGTGKSSFIQSLLVLRQSFEHNGIRDGLCLNGPYTQIGTGGDALFSGAENKEIAFVAVWDELTRKNIFSFSCDLDRQFLPVSPRHDAISRVDLTNISLFNDKFKYLSGKHQFFSNRPDNDNGFESIQRINSVGIYGENTAKFIDYFGVMDVSIDSLKHPKAYNNSLIANITAWLFDFCPSLYLSVAKYMCTSKSEIKAHRINQQNNVIHNILRDENLSQGIKSLLPLITLLLSSNKGDMLVCESPEANLHPQAQSMLGRLCAKAAASGVQIILETHSDHLFNGVRVAVKKQEISPDNVSTLFLKIDMDGRDRGAIASSPQMDNQGRMSFWPKGFFDQWENDLDELI